MTITIKQCKYTLNRMNAKLKKLGSLFYFKLEEKENNYILVKHQYNTKTIMLESVDLAEIKTAIENLVRSLR